MVLGASNVTVHTIGTPAEGYRISTTIAQPDGGATLSPGVSVEWRKGSASPGEDLIPIYWDITIDLSLVVSYFYDEDAAKHEKMHERGHVDAKNAIGQAPYVAKMLAGGRLYAPGVDDPNRQFAQLERVDFPSKISLADSDAPKRLDEYELKLESYISRTMYYGDKLLTHTNPQKTLVGYTDRDQVPYEKMPDGTVRLKDQPPVAPRFRTE